MIWPVKIRPQINRLCDDNEIKPYGLAKQAGLSHSMLWKLRHGKTKGIKFEVLEKLCEALKCEPNDVLMLINQKKTRNSSTRKRQTRS